MDRDRAKARKEILEEVGGDVAAARSVAKKLFGEATTDAIGLVLDAVRGEDDPKEGLADLEGAIATAKQAFDKDAVTPEEVRLVWDEANPEDEDDDDEDEDDEG